MVYFILDFYVLYIFAVGGRGRLVESVVRVVAAMVCSKRYTVLWSLLYLRVGC